MGSLSPSLFGRLILSSNTPHCTGSTIALAIHSFDPLECGNLDISYSIDIEDLYGSSIAFVIHSVDRSLFTRLILWIEERDSDQKVLLAE